MWNILYPDSAEKPLESSELVHEKTGCFYPVVLYFYLNVRIPFYPGGLLKEDFFAHRTRDLSLIKNRLNFSDVFPCLRNIFITNLI